MIPTHAIIIIIIIIIINIIIITTIIVVIIIIISITIIIIIIIIIIILRMVTVLLSERRSKYTGLKKTFTFTDNLSSVTKHIKSKLPDHLIVVQHECMTHPAFIHLSSWVMHQSRVTYEGQIVCTSVCQQLNLIKDTSYNTRTV